MMNANERAMMQRTRKYLRLLKPALLVFILLINIHKEARGCV